MDTSLLALGILLSLCDYSTTRQLAKLSLFYRHELQMSRPSSTAFTDDRIDPSGQFGALCWRMHRGNVQVLLITSRDTGRWIIPKAGRMSG